ncbi:hypothetical protein KFE25_002074 [Diacronema lutheri]|uniref:Uncharacterized protein n=1 Tax=Diacronema lutheri TaxID=2081491 RepID=A0A8J5XKF7_DIALT|nr:hypothetical protein KFE25_002074 [Diacronema lutheri]
MADAEPGTSLFILEHTVHRVDSPKAQPTVRLPSTPGSSYDGLAPMRCADADASQTTELVVSNSRYFSLRVGLVGTGGRISQLWNGEQLHAHAELIYENGLPVQSTHSDSPNGGGKPSADTMLEGETVRALVDGEAAFRLRITALSSRVGHTRFRVRVTVPTHGDPLLPSVLTVLTHPMRSITKLSLKAARPSLRLAPSAILTSRYDAPRASGSGSMGDTASPYGGALATARTAARLARWTGDAESVELARVISCADFDPHLLAPGAATPDACARSSDAAGGMGKRKRMRGWGDDDWYDDENDDGGGGGVCGGGGPYGDDGLAPCALTRFTSETADQHDMLPSLHGLRELDACGVQLVDGAGVDCAATAGGAGGLSAAELEALMTWPGEMLELDMDSELARVDGLASLGASAPRAPSEPCKLRAADAPAVAMPNALPGLQLSDEREGAVSLGAPLHEHHAWLARVLLAPAQRQAEPSAERLACAVEQTLATRAGDVADADNPSQKSSAPQGELLFTIQTEFDELKRSLASLVDLASKRSVTC